MDTFEQLAVRVSHIEEGMAKLPIELAMHSTADSLPLYLSAYIAIAVIGIAEP
ncbi:hypothetical protein [Paraburkholderia dipogonis]|uniref:hypothetical protein n=1 Tax=Paraburkholderia dipogonis TaxID=1211383 RepID=UPI00141BE410|nr:hypothetical protein [Paraburkholderia dipogonis]